MINLSGWNDSVVYLQVFIIFKFFFCMFAILYNSMK